VREEDFVRIIADWRPKTANLAELAEALNLGTDSFVLVDDSAYERGLVRRELPGVVTIGIDDEPALHAERLLSDGWFDARDLTGEDRARPARYRDEIARKSFLDNFDSIGDYLRELAIEVRFCRAAEAEVARVSQLTLRTNQFNLTTVRLQPPDVRQWLDDPAALVATIRSADRFGDNGLVGAVFARREAETMHIENFLLSCRVFSRGIEQACLASLLEHARATGAAAVTGSYRRTAKNHAVADFYPRHGFKPAGSGGGETVSFRHDLLEIASPPEHIQLTVNLEGKPA
jgi:FkbH-like protein